MIPNLLVAVAALTTATAAQDPPQSRELGRFFLVENGPSNHELMIGTFSTPWQPGQRVLMSYPYFQQNSAVPWRSQSIANPSQYGIYGQINLKSGNFATGEQKPIGLSNKVKAVRVNFKLKIAIEPDPSGRPAYAQCDIAASTPSEMSRVLEAESFPLFRQNHLLHCESSLWVAPDKFERNIKNVEAIIPVEYNEDGEPVFSYLFNYGIYNWISGPARGIGRVSTDLSDGPSRGYVEMAMFLVGWYE
jgi:hypothetical protein